MTKRIACLLVAGLLASCGGGAAKTKPIVVNKKPEPGKVGEACKPTEGNDQGSCSAGLFCVPLQGGFCTKPCPCGSGEACIDTAQVGDVCGKSCGSDADCRKDGYTCDPTWKTCTVAGFLAPKAPVCEVPAPPLPRKTFGPAVQMTSATTPGRYQIEPTAALDKDGNVVVVYAGGTDLGVPNHLGAGTYTIKDTVEGDREIKIDDRENHVEPWLAQDSHGKMYLTWLGYNGGRAPEHKMMVGVSTSDDGNTWSLGVGGADLNIDCPGEVPGCLDKPMLAVGPDRNNPNKDVVYIFYYSAASGAMKVTHSMDGGVTFSPSALVGKGAYGDSIVTSSGKLHVVFVGSTSATAGHMFGDASNAILYVNSGDGGATFSAPIKVSGEGESVPIYFSNPQIIADVQRALLYVVYPAGTSDGKWDVVLATSKDGGLSWKRQTVNDDAPCANHMVPAVALDPVSGKLFISWYENRSGVGSLAFTSCATGGGKCAPNELVSDRPFASYSFVRQSSHGLGEYNTLLVDPKRKVLHVVWTQTVDENGVPISRVFHSSTKLK